MQHTLLRRCLWMRADYCQPACLEPEAGERVREDKQVLMCKHTPRVRFVNGVQVICKRAEQTLWTEGKRYCLFALFHYAMYVW